MGALTGSREPDPKAVPALPGFDPERTADLQLALDLALAWLVHSEPGDSRAVSNEFVAMAAISCGITDRLDECREIIRGALARDAANQEQMQ